MRTQFISLLIVMVCCLKASGAPRDKTIKAHEPDNRGAFLELTEENDSLTATLKDRHYTQGLRLLYLGSENRLPDRIEPATCRMGVEIGQSVYTPEDLAASEPLPDDRPYAGWLYAGAVLQRRGSTRTFHIPVLENIRLQLGVIGPAALAQQGQKVAHIFTGTKAQGWDNQLRDEPGLALKYQRAWRLMARERPGWETDFIPHAGASLGNVDTSLRAGAMVRLGRNLPPDFGFQTIDSLGIPNGDRAGSAAGRQHGFYFFGGAEARAVVYSAFLDGNLFRDSSHVRKYPLLAELQTGFVLALQRANLALAYVFRSPEFEGQTGMDYFGSIAVRWML